MAHKRTDRSRSNGQEGRASATGDQLTAADDVAAAAKSATASAQRKAKKRIQKLTRELDRARAKASLKRGGARALDFNRPLSVVKGCERLIKHGPGGTLKSGAMER